MGQVIVAGLVGVAGPGAVRCGAVWRVLGIAGAGRGGLDELVVVVLRSSSSDDNGCCC